MKSRETIVTQVITNAVCLLFTICAVLPFILLVVGSFTDNGWAVANGFSFFPKEFSVEAYRYIMDKWALIGRGFLMTLLVTGIGTALSLTISTLNVISRV